MRKQNAMKKIFSLVLGLVMVMGLAVPTFAAQTTDIYLTLDGLPPTADGAFYVRLRLTNALTARQTFHVG